MKTLFAVAFVTLTVTAVSAQTTPVPAPAPPDMPFGADPVIHIMTTFRAGLEGTADPRDVPTAMAQSTARRQLYNMAANECTVLTEYWKAECHLTSLAVNPAFDGGPDLPRAHSLTGTAVYELRLTSPQR